MHETLLISLSFIVGIIVGLTGIGGASLITPMLILVFQTPASVAISSDVVAATLMKIVGGARHWQQQSLDVQAVKWLTYGSVPGSLIGVTILHQIHQTAALDLDAILLQLLGVAILLITLVALLQMVILMILPSFRLPTLPHLDLATPQGQIGAIGLGAILGCLVGMTSISSGSLFALVLIAFFRLDGQKLVGTDLTQAAILLFFTSLGHLRLGNVDWHLVIPIWLGSVPSVCLGATFCQAAPQKLLRFGIYAILVMISWKFVHPI